MKDVAVVACRDYEKETVSEAVGRALDLLGGLSAFIRPGMKVCIKPNLMRKINPESCLITHPSLVAEVARRCIALGAKVTVAESPGGHYTEAVMRGIYRATGVSEALEGTGAKLDTSCETREVALPGAVRLQKTNMIAPIVEADAVISISKLKTHTLTTFSAAVKNLYGVIPGLTKAEYHMNNPETGQFCNMLVDIAARVKPVLNLIDAVYGMEGEGPGESGTPRYLGMVVASAGIWEADACASELLGYEKDEIPYLKLARERGLFDGEYNRLGDEIVAENFVKATVGAREGLLDGRIPKFLIPMATRLLQTRPEIDEARCVGCGICAGVCPKQAILVKDKKAHISAKKCIRCFCCMEFCPKKAVLAQRSKYSRWAIAKLDRQK